MRAPGLTVRHGDIETEQFAPGSFDFILAGGVFSVLKSPSDLLARAV